VACDATARLYDVDEDTLVFKKLQKSEKYDQGTVTFRARSGRLIDLDKLHESIWATRLSGGTRSGLVSLEVTAIGKVSAAEEEAVLAVAGSDSQFVLRKNADGDHADAFDQLMKVAGSDSTVRVTGRIADYSGRWPDVLQKRPAKPRQILVTKIEIVKQS
jgi:hypothetical protein